MKTSVMVLLEDAQKKMSGYAALYNYRLHNLNVKADAAALLSISVEFEEEELPLEKVAKARNPEDREDQFEIYPLDRALLLPIVKGIKMSHPEYDLDIRNIDDDQDAEETEKDKYILATMPIVDDNRHDVLTEGVKALSDACKAMLDLTVSRCTAEMTVKLVGAPPEELDEAKDALQQIRDMHDELVQQYHDDKEKEIEDAYAVWQAVQAEKEAKKQEQDAAHNVMAGLQMKMNPEEDE